MIADDQDNSQWTKKRCVKPVCSKTKENRPESNLSEEIKDVKVLDVNNDSEGNLIPYNIKPDSKC